MTVRATLRLLALETAIARPYLRFEWDARRESWRVDVMRASCGLVEGLGSLCAGEDKLCHH